jgi:carboxypeptidase C (cathepsin A)
MHLDQSLRRNVSFTYYEAGHMMYIDVRSLRKFHADVSTFIAGAVKK